jgi:hypothetical protein
MSPVLPINFGESCVGQVLRYRHRTGWCRGLILECKKVVRGTSSEGYFTCVVRWNGEPATARETLRLRPSLYKAAALASEAAELPQGAWNVLLTTVRESDEVAQQQQQSESVSDTEPLRADARNQRSGSASDTGSDMSIESEG